MTKNTKKEILLNVAVLIVVAMIIGYYFFNKGPLDVRSQDGIVATPTELYTYYITDSMKAHKKFDDKVIRIKGEVSEVTENTQKKQVVIFKTASSGGNINCTMEEAIPGIKKGDVVEIKGICNGLGQGDPDLGIMGDVYLTRSFISK